MNKIELIQYNNCDKKFIQNPKIDGYCVTKLQEHMLEDSSMSKINHIFSNCYKFLNYLLDPTYDSKGLSKILCLGKVQSGKTAFFIGSIALAFDNGYNIAYVIGGTKTKLKNQNYDRLDFEFNNNDKIKIIDINNTDFEDPELYLKMGYKVIIVALKNISSITANLGTVESISNRLSNYPSIVIDDEGDECTPGAPKSKRKNNKAGRTHDVISDILKNIKICTFLSVTATPQANFLISTIDELSPDYALLVEPGEGYTGGNAFHDVENNKHTIEISDSGEFSQSIPESFKNALYFFIFSLLTFNCRGITKKFSMLVHPSALTIVQAMVVEKIRDYFNTIYLILSNNNNFAFESTIYEIYNSGKDAVNDYNDFDDFKDKVLQYLPNILNNIVVYEFNVSKRGKIDIENSELENKKYKIYVGGNMLGRGLTIENLNVTYMYRDSKISQIDTLYQRARWFGYKQSYFDLCRVYMTRDLKKKFIDTVDNENDMWNTLNSFLLTKTDIKKFPRIFTLKNDKLRLTRNTVAKTVFVERINPGYNYDTDIYLSEKDILNNRNLYYDFLNKNIEHGTDIKYGLSERQHHYVIEMSYKQFYDDFITKYVFPKGSRLGINTFGHILKYVNDNISEDKVSIVFMRYKTGEYRSSFNNGQAIKELPQSYDNGTQYPGDKDLPELKNTLHVQIHPVYLDKDKPDEIVPILALNNPITDYNVNYVTGDNYYG